MVRYREDHIHGANRRACWLGRCPVLSSRDDLGAVEKWLAVQVPGDVASLADGGLGGFGVTEAGEVSGVIEQAVGQVVRG